MMFVIYDEFDDQSSKKTWQVWYPHRKNGFATREETESRIANSGAREGQYHIVEMTLPMTPHRTAAAVTTN